MRKEFLILIFASISLLLVAGFCFAQRELELTYPDIPGAIRPVSTRALLPETLIYLFSLAIRISGLIVFGSLMYGGVLYLTSTGNPKKHKDAQDQILNSFLGLALILFSFLLLKTINPQLIKLSIAKQLTTQGIIVFKDFSSCNEFRNDHTKYDELVSDGKALKITSSVPHLRNFLGENYEDSIGAVYSFEDQEDLEIQTFNEENWVEGPVIQSVGKEDCVLGFAFASAKSIKLIPKPPGVYLCCGGTYDGNWTCQEEERYLSASTAALPSECHDQVQGIKFKPLKEYVSRINPNLELTVIIGILGQYEEECQKKGGSKAKFEETTGNIYCLYDFAAVLHNNANYRAECEVFLESMADLSGSNVIKSNTASSVTVFRPIQEEFAEGTGVTLHSMRQYTDPTGGPGPYGPWKEIEAADTNTLGITDPSQVNSLEIAPAKRYIAILFEGLNYTKRCEVFEKSDEDFINNDIGKTGCEQFWEGGCHPSIKSLKIYPTR